MQRLKSKDHHYRTRAHSKDLIACRVQVKETDLLVSACTDLSQEASDRVHHYRIQLEAYIRRRPEFLSALLPYPADPFAPQIIREMISASSTFGVGPMAAVAGTIAQFVGRDLLQCSEEVIVENGGDIFIKTNRPATISIYAGSSPLSGKLGLILSAEEMPAGVCTSSGTVGHSLSLGKADAVCIVARSASIADAAATALGNRIRRASKLQEAIDTVRESDVIKGGVAIVGMTMASWGDVELTDLTSAKG
jgi:ApbE superfamily uncharacterized protein (UPF0280 family)